MSRASFAPRPWLHSSRQCLRPPLRQPASSPLALFHSSTGRYAEDNNQSGPSSYTPLQSTNPQQRSTASPRSATTGSSPPPSLKQLSSMMSRVSKMGPPGRSTADVLDAFALDYDAAASNPENYMRNLPQPPHHLHIYATKHNTHITLTRPDRNAIISVATGNLGFKKAARGSYDAAYQLGAWVLNRIQSRGLLREILELELVLRGYGAGREAVTKILLGIEGKSLRDRVVRVTDATRLKFGGTRSKKPRRLG